MQVPVQDLKSTDPIIYLGYKWVFLGYPLILHRAERDPDGNAIFIASPVDLGRIRH